MSLFNKLNSEEGKLISIVAGIILILSVIAYPFYAYIICYEHWTASSFCKNGNFVLDFPESKLTLVVAIDYTKLPPDWNCERKNLKHFIVSGYGSSGGHAVSRGVTYYTFRYNWKNHKQSIEIFSHKIEIYRGRKIKIGSQEFTIDHVTPLILGISADGNVKQLPDY
ncbi:MAG: hypothetical protein LBE18_00120 [Planctomycetaceae bacterium]|jgi:hypothetical protein|nr:hypothetical protein [Planctomycetaceae bacterium]